MNLFRIDRAVIMMLVCVDAIAIVVSMIAGPLDHSGISLGASLSAIILSVSILIYGLLIWKKR